MAANTRFAVALHLLTALAWLGGVQSSEVLAAGTVNTNPVVLRRILGRLVRAGLVEAHPGKSGGFRLARPASRIRLLDVYRAVDEDGLFAIHDHPEIKACPVSCGIRPALAEVFAETQAALEASLRRTRLSDLVRRIPGEPLAARARAGGGRG